MLIGSKSNVLCPFFGSLVLVFLTDSQLMSLEIRFVRILSLGWVDSRALIKYLNDEDNVMSILAIIIWFSYPEFVVNMQDSLYDVSSNIIAQFLLVTVLLLQQHMYTIRFLFVNRLQFFPHMLSWFTIDNIQK